MRPEILYSLFQPVTTLPGVGPRLGTLFERLAGDKIVDLLWHLPVGRIDRRFTPKLAEAPDGVVATILVRVGAHHPPPNKRQPYRIACSDETGEIELVFFHGHEEYLKKTLPEGSSRVLSGKIDHFRGRLQMTHPDHIAEPADIERLISVEPVYPLTTGLTPKTVARAITGALARAPDLPEWIDATYLARQGWASWPQSLRRAHAPDAAADLAPDAPARARLAYDELLASQLAVALVRAQTKRLPGRELRARGHLKSKALAALPFDLTAGQETALAEILADMASPRRMVRMLQGDVGSGKTVVAFLAMLTAGAPRPNATPDC